MLRWLVYSERPQELCEADILGTEHPEDTEFGTTESNHMSLRESFGSYYYI
jgi:hypothetical protein